MRYILIITLLFAAPSPTCAQGDAGILEKKLQAHVSTLAAQGKSAVVLLRSLLTAKGKMVGAEPAGFSFKQKKRTTFIRYSDVLEISGGGETVSLIPDPKKQSHGNWQDIAKVYAATRMILVLNDGTSYAGYSNSITDTEIIFIDGEKHERKAVNRDDVAAFYGLVGGYGGVKKNASKAAEGMTNSRDQLLGGIFVGASALFGIAKSDGRLILIYSN